MIQFLRAMVQAILALRYRIRVKGINTIVQRGRRGILFLPNHPAMIDPVIVMASLHRTFQPRALADQHQIDRFFIRTLAKKAGVRPILDMAKDNAGDARASIEAEIDSIIELLRSGENTLLYPAGRLQRSITEDLGGNSAVHTILQALPDVRIVLVRTRGLWGSRFGYASGKQPQLDRILKRGFWQLLASFIFFLPRRKVTLELVEPDDLPRLADRTALNRYLESFYNTDPLPNTFVPSTIWDWGGTRVLPEPTLSAPAGALDAVGQATRTQVYDYLHDLSGVENLTDDLLLARDLSLDSLARADVLAFLSSEFGPPQTDVDSLRSVGDVLLAAAGETVRGESVELKPVAPMWFAEEGNKSSLTIPAGETITDLFLKQAKRWPTHPVVADQTSGVRTYRDVLMGVFALRNAIAALPGQYVGIMLPASVGATVAYIATLFTGKTPVMVNWTVGELNMHASLDGLDVKHVITAGALVSKLQGQGTRFGDIEDRFVYLETIGKELSLWTKLSALLRSKLGLTRPLKQITPSPTAVVLFTSGSETLPKAVPLTHENVITNIRDALQVYDFHRNDRLLAMLPPFHSFGLTVGTVIPLIGGLSTVFHPNPTEGDVLAEIIETYRATMLIGTPTFIRGICRNAKPNQLDTIRFAVTGAEACPESTYDLLQKMCPQAIVAEGYGITECSPIAFLNRPGHIVHQSIGQALPSVEAIVVHPETLEPVEAGQTGLLLLRGPSIFDGYLSDAPDPFVQAAGKSWYRTGDLVSLDANGIAMFKGRMKRFVKIGGEMISLPALESVLEKQLATGAQAEGPAVAVESTDDENRPELVLFTTLDVTRQDANQAIADGGLSSLYNIRRVELLEEIPLLGTGKTNYRVLKELLR